MTKHISFLLGVLFSVSLPFMTVHAAQTPPQIFTYQGRLTDSGGNLLGSSSGTSYSFKFSIWDSPTAGSQLWPVGTPTTISTLVRQGVFTVNIGDTAHGYPDTLNLDFSANQNIYLEVAVYSGTSNVYEPLLPRQQITSVAFAQVAGAVVGATTPSLFGTLTPATNSFVTMAATSIASIPLTIAAFAGQLANLFQIKSSTGTGLFAVDNNGNAWVGCPDGNCGVSAPATGGNIIVEKAVIFGNKFRFEQIDASTTVMYDTTNNPIFEFDEGGGP